MSGEGDPQVGSWERFFKTYCREAINEAAVKWPTEKSLIIDYFHIENHDGNLAQFLLDHPYEALATAAEALKLVDVPAVENVAAPKFNVRVANLPSDRRIGVNELRIEHAGKLVQVNGIFQGVSPPTSKLIVGLFICSRCGAAVQLAQDGHLSLEEPKACFEDQGGCGRDADFKLVYGTHRGKGSVFTDLQIGLIQEPPENVQGTRPPVRVPSFMEDDLCGQAAPSERVNLTAVVRVAERRNGNKKTNLFDFFLEVNHIAPEKRDYEDVDPTPEEIQKFRELASDPELMEKLVGSIAPSIYGMRAVKQAILLQLFGGVSKTVGDRYIRGDLHVLVVGDPGISKTELGLSAVRLSPRGQYVEALGATVAGVVGGVEKVEKSLAGEGWIYTAGVASMAHRGLLHLDEADKAKDENLLPALLVPLEQQRASINKQGARGLVVKCEFALFATSNPKNGRFDPHQTDKLGQIDFPRPFLDRMDLIFAYADAPDEARDARVVDTMLRTHAAGTAIRRGDALSPTVESVKPSLDPDFLRRYIAWAKRTIFPTIPLEVAARIKGKYLTQRRKRSQDADSPVGYSPRTVNTLTRLAEASARMRLSEIVSDDDLTFAMDLYNEGWEKLATNSRGEIDADRLGVAPSFDQRESMRLLKEITADLQGEEGVKGDEVVAQAVSRGIDRDTAVKGWARWKIDGTLMEKMPGRYVLVNTPARPRREPERADDDRRVRWS